MMVMMMMKMWHGRPVSPALWTSTRCAHGLHNRAVSGNTWTHGGGGGLREKTNREKCSPETKVAIPKWHSTPTVIRFRSDRCDCDVVLSTSRCGVAPFRASGKNNISVCGATVRTASAELFWCVNKFEAGMRRPWRFHRISGVSLRLQMPRWLKTWTYFVCEKPRVPIDRGLALRQREIGASLLCFGINNFGVRRIWHLLSPNIRVSVKSATI